VRKGGKQRGSKEGWGARGGGRRVGMEIEKWRGGGIGGGVGEWG